MLRLDRPAGDTVRFYADEIRKSSERAARLTQQLLAFSRKQILQPVRLDLNTLIRDFERMLPRITREDIALEIVLDPELGFIEADPGQIEQVILNLAINARDAMPKGGKLTIETKKVYTRGEKWLARNDLQTGWWTRLRVSDTGQGMDQEVLKHIYEPFYTTKEKSSGTGLGLATVYGIVKQSGGQINVQSALNRGTIFDIFFPQIDAATEERGQEERIDSLHGTETVLIVEDEDAVRNLMESNLRSHGYTVLSAANGELALKLCEERRDLPVQLLLTDVIMPGMGGQELAERLKRRMPDMKILFISGYTDDAIDQQGVVAEKVPFLQKPFTQAQLLQKLRSALD
jgi:CheY-like chemotaxis protein